LRKFSFKLICVKLKEEVTWNFEGTILEYVVS
jgi:hypothetical protein